MKSLNDINKELNVKDEDFKKIFAILSEYNGDVDIVFNNYEHMPKSVIKLIQQTHRFIIVNKNLKIPVLYQMDVASLTVKKEGLPHLPYGGHLVKIDYKGTKVLEETVLF